MSFEGGLDSKALCVREVCLNGIKTEISGSPDDHYVQNAQNHANDLAPLFAYAANTLLKTDIVFDVGANIGLSPIALARIVAHGHVYAFEPSTINSYNLRKNLERNGVGNVTVIDLAVSARASQVYLNHVAASGAASHILPTLSDRANVEAIDLDTFVVTHNLGRVAFLKIDVEGHEPWVLAGAKSLTDSGQTRVWMEFNSWCLMAFGKVQPVDFATALFHAFTVQLIKNGQPSPVDSAISFVHDNIIVHSCVNDLLLLPKEHHTLPLYLGIISDAGEYATAAIQIEQENVNLRREVARLSQSPFTRLRSRLTRLVSKQLKSNPRIPS